MIRAKGRSIFIARHGERLDFVDGKWRDTALLPDDPPLTERGEVQAMQLGQRLRGCGITSVYASPFQRCTRTAALAAGQFSSSACVNVEPGVCERLSTVRYWQTEHGPLWQGVDALCDVAGLVDGHPRINTQYQPVFGYDFNRSAYPETTPHMKERCSFAVQHIVNRDTTGGNVLIVGHVSSVKAMVCALVPGTSPIIIPCKWLPFLLFFF